MVGLETIADQELLFDLAHRSEVAANGARHRFWQREIGNQLADQPAVVLYEMKTPRWHESVPKRLGNVGIGVATKSPADRRAPSPLRRSGSPRRGRWKRRRARGRRACSAPCNRGP